MGGKKRLKLKQMAKIQSKKEREQKERKSRVSTMQQRRIGLSMPNLKSQKVIDELRSMRALTPYTVASHFDLRLSVAKELLKELERRRIIEYVSGGKNLKIYKPLVP